MSSFLQTSQQVILGVSSSRGPTTFLTNQFITFDASVSETHTSEYEVTAHPVEGGVDITDHKRRKPRELTLNVIVSDDLPLSLLPVERQALAFQASNRAVTAWETLKQYQQEAQLYRVLTTLETYEDMAIVSISVPRDARRGNTLDATIVLREIQIVFGEEVDALLVPRPPQKSNGSTQAQEKDVENANANQSIGVSIGRGLGFIS